MEAIPAERRAQLGLHSGTDLDWKATAVPSTDLTAQEVEGELLILDLGRSEYFSLNDVGTAIWGLLCAGNTLEQVAEALCARYQVGHARAREDLAALVIELEAKGLISLRAEGHP